MIGCNQEKLKKYFALTGLIGFLLLGLGCGKGFEAQRVQDLVNQTADIQSFDLAIQSRISNGDISGDDFDLTAEKIADIQSTCSDSSFNPLDAFHSSILGIGKSGVLYMLFTDLCSAEAPSVDIFIDDSLLGNAIILENVAAQYLVNIQVDPVSNMPIYLLEFPLFYQYLNNPDWIGAGLLWVSAQNTALVSENYRHEAVSIDQPLKYEINSDDYLKFGPALNKPLVDSQVLEGRSLAEGEFCARLNGFSVQYRWIKSGKLATYNDTSNECYFIDAASTLDQGDYTLEFLMAGKSILSTPQQNLKVNLAGVVIGTNLPSNLNKIFGTTLRQSEFCATFAGTAISYIWEKEVPAASGNWLPVAGQTNRCLNLGTLNFVASGNYRITGSNASQVNASSAGTILVEDQPPASFLEISPPDIPLASGSSLADNSYCAAYVSGGGTNLVYTWERTPDQIANTGSIYATVPPQFISGPCIIFSAFSGADEGTYKVVASNSKGSSNPAFGTIIFGPERPLIQNNCNGDTLEQDAAYTCTLIASDLNKNSLSWTVNTSISNGCSWMSLQQFPPNSTKFQLIGTPDDDDVGSCDVELTATDSTGLSSPTVVATITVTNRVPSFTAPQTTPTSKSIDEDVNLGNSTPLVIFSDAQIQTDDEGFGVYSLDDATAPSPICNDPANIGRVTVDPATGELTFDTEPDYFDSNPCYIKVLFDDGNGTTVSHLFEITVNAVNDPPVINSSDAGCSNTTLNEDGAGFTCLLSFSDTDDLGAATWSVAAGSDCATAPTIGTNGTLTYSPTDADVPSCSMTVKISDNATANPKTDTVTFNFVVNDVAPVLTPFGNPLTTLENTPIVPLDIDTDEEGAGAIYSFDSSLGDTIVPAKEYCHNHGVVTIDSTTGLLTYNPANQYSGTCAVSVKVIGSPNLAAVAPAELLFDVTVNVSFVDELPTITPDTGAGGCAISETVTADTGSFNCALTGSDPENTNLSWAVTESGSCSGVTISSGGPLNSSASIAYSPTTSDVGTISNPNCTLTITASDTAGNSSAVYSVVLAINNNSPPVIDSGSCPTAVNLKEGADTFSESCTATDVDEPGNTAFIWSLDTTGTGNCSVLSGTNSGFVTIDSDTGLVNYAPTNDQVGNCNIKIVATDTAGNPSVAHIVKVTVDNEDPIIYSLGSNPAVIDGSTETIDVDSDDEGLGAVYSLNSSLSGPGYCHNQGAVTVTDSNTGTYTYTPVQGFSGSSCKLAVRVSDGTSSKSAEFDVGVSCSSLQIRGFSTDRDIIPVKLLGKDELKLIINDDIGAYTLCAEVTGSNLTYAWKSKRGKGGYYADVTLPNGVTIEDDCLNVADTKITSTTDDRYLIEVTNYCGSTVNSILRVKVEN